MSYSIQNGGHDHSLVIGRDEKSPLMEKKEEEEKEQNAFQRACTFFFSEGNESYVDTLLKSNFFFRAVKFFPALLITFGIELGNSAVLSKNQDVLNDHFTLVLFIPVISAIAGNIGLQTSSSVTAYINLQNDRKEEIKTVWLLVKYTSHCAVQVVVLSLLMGILAAFWSPTDVCHWPYGLVILCGAATT